MTLTYFIKVILNNVTDAHLQCLFMVSITRLYLVRLLSYGYLKISDTNLTLTYFIKVIINNVTDAHLQCLLIVSITRLYLVQLLSYGYLKISDPNLTLTYFIKVILQYCNRCISTVTTYGFNYKAVSFTVAELWLFENSVPEFDLDLLYQGHSKIMSQMHICSVFLCGFNHRAVSCMIGKL